MTASISLPIAVPVSSGSAPDIASTLSETSCVRGGDNLQQVADQPSSACPALCKRTDRPRAHSRVPPLAAGVRPSTTPAREKTLSHPAARSSRSWASRPAIWPAVEVRAYPRAWRFLSHWDYNETIQRVSNLSRNLCETELPGVAQGTMWAGTRSPAHGAIRNERPFSGRRRRFGLFWGPWMNLFGSYIPRIASEHQEVFSCCGVCVI